MALIPNTTRHSGNTRNDWLISFEINEKRYIPVTAEEHKKVVKGLHTVFSTRPEHIKHMAFSANLGTVVINSNAGEVHYVVCVERTK